MWSRGSGVGQEKVERHPPSASKDPARPSQQQLQVQVQSRSSCGYRGAALAAGGAAAGGSESCSRGSCCRHLHRPTPTSPPFLIILGAVLHFGLIRKYGCA